MNFQGKVGFKGLLQVLCEVPAWKHFIRISGKQMGISRHREDGIFLISGKVDFGPEGNKKKFIKNLNFCVPR